MDLQDVCYNIVNWIEWQMCSWFYVGGVIDLWIGEIVKGNVVFEGLWLWQDIILFEGLVGIVGNNSGIVNDFVWVLLVCICQFGVYEVGYVIGFVYNFVGSMQGCSLVMDYLFVWMMLIDGKIDLFDVYVIGIGVWDKFIVDWLYG